MSAIDDGGPAFPRPQAETSLGGNFEQEGMTMRKLPRDLVLILRTEAKNQRTPAIRYVFAEDGVRMVHLPDPDIAMAELLDEAAAALEALSAENERLRKALKEIENLSERPYDKFPSDWRDQIAVCPECQRYKDHPIQRGICDDHRKPLYDREDHNRHETSVLGYRAKSIAREALAALSPAPEAQQEPVAWGEFYGGKIVAVSLHKSHHYTVPLYTRPSEQAVTEALTIAHEALEAARGQILGSYRTWVADDKDAKPRYGQYPRYDQVNAAIRVVSEALTALQEEGR